MAGVVGIGGAAYAVAVKRYYLARVNVAQELGAHYVEGAGLAAHYVSSVEFSKAQRLDPVLVAAGVDAAWGHDYKGESAFHHVEGLDYVDDTVFAGVFLDEVRQQLAVDVGLEDSPAFLEVAGNLGGVDDIAVGGHRKVAAAVVEKQRLHIVQASLGVVRILYAAYAERSFEMGNLPVGEDFAQKAKATVAVILSILVEGGYSTAFLSAVLKVVQTIIDPCRGVLDAEYCQNSH